MPKKKDYPKWFSQYFKPCVPIKPEEFLTKEKILGSGNYNDQSIQLDALPIGTKSIYIAGHSYDDYGGASIEIDVTFYGEPEKFPNPHYKKLLKQYEKEYEEYKTKLLEWTKYKKKWDEETKKELESYEKKQYEKLKKKFAKE